MYAAKEENEDPLCQLISSSEVDNQYSRICVKALTSSYFRHKLKYVRNVKKENKCRYQEVSFQKEYTNEAAPEKYYKWMLICTATDMKLSTELKFYISRAYDIDSVFIYKLWKEGEEEKVYLENLSTNFSIKDTPSP